MPSRTSRPVTCPEVQLRRHQPVGGLDHRAVDVEALQGARGLESEESAADDGADERTPELGRASLHELLELLDVVEGAVDEAAFEAEAVDGQTCGVGARREDEAVVGHARTAARRHAARAAVDAGDGLAAEEPHALVVEHCALELEVFGRGAREEPGQSDPVVGVALLLADERDAPLLAGPAEQALDEAVGDHARADDHHVGAKGRGRTHAVTVRG